MIGPQLQIIETLGVRDEFQWCLRPCSGAVPQPADRTERDAHLQGFAHTAGRLQLHGVGTGSIFSRGAGGGVRVLNPSFRNNSKEFEKRIVETKRPFGSC